MKISSLSEDVIEIWFGDVNSVPQGWVISDGGVHNGVQTVDLRGLYLAGVPSLTGLDLNVVEGGNETPLPNNAVNLKSGGEHNHDVNHNSGTTASGEGAHSHTWNSTSAFNNVYMSHWNTSSGLANSNNYNFGRMLYNTNNGDFDKADVQLKYDNGSNTANHSHSRTLEFINGNTNTTSHSHTVMAGDSTTEPKNFTCHLITFVGF